MEQQESVTVEQSVLELLRHIAIVFPVRFFDTIYVIAILLIHRC